MSKKSDGNVGQGIGCVFAGIPTLLMILGVGFVPALKITFGLFVAAIVIFILVWISSKRQAQILDKSLRLADVDHMEGLEFEKYVGRLMKAQGYSVTVTPPSGDYGVDVIAMKDGNKIAVQVKRYSNSVSPKAVSEVVGGRQFYRCSSTMVVTNSTFTTAARKLAKANNCILVDRSQLAKWIVEYSGGGTIHEPHTTKQKGLANVSNTAGSTSSVRVYNSTQQADIITKAVHHPSTLNVPQQKNLMSKIMQICFCKTNRSRCIG